MLDMARKRNVQMSTPTERLVIGYVRVSTDGQVDSGASLSAQKASIENECRRNGWTLLTIVEDAGISAKSMDRPGLQNALQMLSNGEAHVLMASKLDRLSRSTRDVCEIGDMALRYGWDLCLLDARIDTTTPHGRAQLSMMAIFAQLERELIGVRTKEALAVKKSQGVKLGRPQLVPEQVALEIRSLRSRGLSLRAVADHLNASAVPTGQGGRQWYASSVQSVLEREDADYAERMKQRSA